MMLKLVGILKKRDYGADVLDTGQRNPSLDIAEIVVEHGKESSSKDTIVEDSNANIPILGEKGYIPKSLALEDCEGSGSEKTEKHNPMPEEGQRNSENAVSKSSFLPSGTNTDIWKPPEPYVLEHDMDSVAFNDDDDDYCGGTTWGQSSSLSSFDENSQNHHSHKEEWNKAMTEARNGQFKTHVIQLLGLEGLGVSNGDGGENWLDIVIALSWEAALLVKPDANEGRAMDPRSYVKVKCIASGTGSQSQVIKALVFKKNTAHKHMPTKLRNPRLLLLKGSLGDSAVGLSSLKSMDQEEEYKQAFAEMINYCNPNVVLVEKTVSRGIQEFLNEKGIALAFDMKLRRLERIARCTGSQIISSADILFRPKLKQCDSFHVEKFVEEYDFTGEGGKKPTKTLMFLEGFPRPLGCTILLKGAHREKLKKVKSVLRYAVISAYHLILETAFFVDQKTFFYDTKAVKELNDTSISESGVSLNGTISIAHDLSGATAGSSPLNITSDLPISNVPISDGKLLSPVSASLWRFNIPPIIDSISSHVEVNETFDPRTKENARTEQEETGNRLSNGEKAGVELIHNINIERTSDTTTTEVKIEGKDDIESSLDSKSILVLRSKYCIPKQEDCEQGHVSRIYYYGKDDMSLGHFLEDILLCQEHSCSSCGQPPEDHIYRYTHKNGTLSVLIRRLSREFFLSGEDEGKIWMWTQCLKCEHKSGTRKTRRVVMSSAARRFSFGKFLELSLASHSAASRTSRCGHLLHRDCLRFFGLGTKVAMFRYTSVEIYTACKPPPMLEFCNPSEQEWFLREAKDVLSKGDIFFTEIAQILKKLKPKCSSTSFKQHMELSSSAVEFDEVEKMLMQEKTEFEDSLKNGHKILNLNWLIQELLLMLYIWDRRLHSVSLHARDVETSNDAADEILHEVQSYTAESSPFSSFTTGVEESISVGLDRMHEDNSVSVSIEPLEPVEKVKNLEEPEVDKMAAEDSQMSDEFKMDDPKWIWSPFSKLRKELRQDLHDGLLIKFEFINTYSPTYLSMIPQLATQVMDSLHFSIGPGGNVISVIEDEISSIISCALALSEASPASSEKVIGAKEREGKGDTGNEVIDTLRVTDISETCTESFETERIKSSKSFSSLSPSELATFGSDGSLFDDRLIPMENLHPETTVGSYKFAGKSKYSVVCIYAKLFYSLRKKCCSSEMAYIASLSHCKKWDAQGGKSKAVFEKTMDDRLIIKQIKKPEFESFLKFGPYYFKHVYESLNSGSQTCLAKILGLYQVRQYKSGKEVKTDIVVMENLFFGRKVSRKYDLKGSVYSRYISNSNNSESVFLDQNFVEDMRVSPIYIGGKDKHVLDRAIWNDTFFLTSIDVMDYSLLVGVDRKKKEIVFGIIDYLRQYTWDKHFETWVKSNLVVPKNELPTVISPKEYKRRFRKFMSKYFLTLDTCNSQQI
ncbi:1-phosphatidylinositol-3-phosphate 5-kinase FAB1A-like isoform X2 [Asparagus officinalis]|uniref:1-phosphatidylinositol-3-phosphate 5-kinase FAB1A-like isoform X2 n=1 Tax=Asparagus officinalis TaxID=4686 RepID=UPI00098DEC92|nr:1-phosphatidylinositol-3-phosphate 5-kinase FAB1A-like isoform X2 [Asparagus officinalis]